MLVRGNCKILCDSMKSIDKHSFLRKVDCEILNLHQVLVSK